MRWSAACGHGFGVGGWVRQKLRRTSDETLTFMMMHDQIAVHSVNQHEELSNSLRAGIISLILTTTHSEVTSTQKISRRV